MPKKLMMVSMRTFKTILRLAVVVCVLSSSAAPAMAASKFVVTGESKEEAETTEKYKIDDELLAGHAYSFSGPWGVTECHKAISKGKVSETRDSITETVELLGCFTKFTELPKTEFPTTVPPFKLELRADGVATFPSPVPLETPGAGCSIFLATPSGLLYRINAFTNVEGKVAVKRKLDSIFYEASGGPCGTSGTATNTANTLITHPGGTIEISGPHYYKNGTLIKEGERVPVIGWGTLTLTSAAGSVTCHSASTGYVENAPGAGAGVGATQAFSTYECVTAACPLETRAEAFKLPWASELFEDAGVTRSRSTGVEVVIGCWTGPPTGPGNLSTAERGSPAAELLPFSGESTPKLASGKTATKPTHVQFGAGSGELINGKVGGGKTTGEATLMGYTAQETITTGA